eukprot:TRINITY_DN14747_c0_g1_i1.p1 TRINITY_DN14747_c0_g1~~TRINITY_DN14747_c0_g1_i1.p1  ORF type:complete len:276 (+),score=40.74 TRINITY_DN14747_c0_g1_i1:89-916(+)
MNFQELDEELKSYSTTSQEVVTPDGGAKKRCIQCKKFYDPIRDRDCVYHPGQFLPEGTTGVNYLIGWTCCHEPTMSGTGCVKAQHKQDYVINAILDRYFPPTTTDGNQTPTYSPPQQTASPKKKPMEWSSPDPNQNYIEHKVLSTDTFIGLALKYNTTVDAIKRANKLYSNSLPLIQNLKIPLKGPAVEHKPRAEDPAVVQRELVRQFVKKNQCSQSEARYYLEEAEWKVEPANLAYEADSKWEGTNQLKKTSVEAPITNEEPTGKKNFCGVFCD